jgi:ferrochelatase
VRVARYLPEPPYRHGTPTRPGILLINLGTPDAPTAPAVKRYLREFLSDPRVIEIPRVLWAPILHGIILNTRARQSADKYAKIWTPQGSPLAVHTAQQAAMLQGFLGERLRTPFSVAWAMRYGNPALAEGLDTLKRAGCDRILAVPLYPQYSAAATGSACDGLFAALVRTRNVPALRVVRHFHDHPGYIAALAQNIRDYWMKHGRPDRLIMSFHGLPRFSLDRGDPYHCECHATGRLLAAALGLKTDEFTITFQSRFGRTQWLQPYTALTLSELGRGKLRRVDVVCPGFVADCLETLEEIDMEGRAAFLAAGGGEFHYIPCLNERDDWLHALTDIVQANLGGWTDAPPSADALQQSELRARALGATH